MKKTFFILFVSLIFLSNIKAQEDTTKHGVLFEKNIYHVINNSQKHIDPNIDPKSTPNAQTSSGKFQFYFEDIILNNAYGFNGPNGAGQVLCVVAAFEYIESVISIPTLTDPIKIYIASSNATNFPNGANDGLAWSSIYYDQTWSGSTNLPVSFSGGYLYDHITTGITPTDPHYDYDGELAFNLQNFTFTTNCNNAIPSCAYDLFSVALHEATHLLGFVSSIYSTIPPVPGNYYPYSPNNPIASRINTNRYSKFDQLFLYSYDQNTQTFTKLIDANGINPLFAGINDISNNSFWISNTAVAGNVPKTNQPICSRNSYSSGTTLSHLDDSYRCRSYVSPQFVPDYVMCPAGRPEHNYLYTLQEIRILHDLGYTINTTQFLVSDNNNQLVTSASLSNRPPRTINDNWVINPNPNPALDYNSDFTYLQPNVTPNGFVTTLQNNTGAYMTFDLSYAANLGFVDDDNDPISVYPGSLVNIQGCSNGVNNQNCLTLSTNGRVITFTPRTNFIGKAQFGFNLYDGKEMGAFVVITVNVTQGNAVSNGNELVLNGTFEEGSETHTTDHEDISTNYIGYLSSNRLSDCVSYSTYCPIAVIRNSRRDCYNPWISMYYTPPYFTYANPPLGEGWGSGVPNDNRFAHLGSVINTTPINFYLSQPVSPGCSYRLSFDIAQDDDNNPQTNDFDLYYGFGTDICTNSIQNPTFISFPNTPNTPYHTFRHFTTDITIPCNTTYNSNILSIYFHGTYNWQAFIDNVSLQLLTTNYTQLSGTLISSPSAHTVYVVNGNLQINGNVSLTASELRMGPASSITVMPGATLNILGSHLYNICNDMWNGITVQPGGFLNILSYTYNSVLYTPMIEDALTAIDIQGYTTITSPNILTVENATFNRNKTDISIAHYGQQISPYPFSISNSVFTCRDIPFTPNSLSWPLTSTIKATYTPSSPLISPYINPSVYSETNANAYLKNPLSGQKSRIAIDLSDVGVTINPSTTPTYYEIKIGTNGTTTFNVFDNHSICINAAETNLTCINSVFQNTVLVPVGHGYTGSIGINASTKYNNRLQVTSGTGAFYYNKFFNCMDAIVSVDYFENTIRYCDIRSTQSNSGAPVLPLYHVGRKGINVNTDRFRNVNISNNSEYNIESPVIFNASFGTFDLDGTPYYDSQYSGNVSIQSNTIRPNLSGQTVTTQYIYNAIQVNNIISTDPTILVPNTTVSVSYNNITSAYRGILSNNWQNKNLTVNNNTISLVSDPFNFTGTNPQYGISLNNDIPNTIGGLSIASNSVTGFNTTYQYCKAIYTSLCTSGVVNCNTVTNTYEGLVFNGAEAPMQTSYNTMSNHHYGFVLDNTGVIGTQGTPTAPCDNVYTQPYATYWPAGSYFTATLNPSTSQNSKMYVRQTGYNANPDGFGTSTTPPYTTNNYASSNGSLLWATGTFIGCGGGGGGSSMSGMSSSAETDLTTGTQSSEQATALTVQTLENTVTSPVDSAHQTPETEFIAKNQVYRLLKAIPGFMNGSTVLQHFYTQSDASTMGLLKRIEDKLSEGDFTASRSMTASIQPQNAVEANYKTFLGLYLNYRTGGFGTADSTALLVLANNCPFTGGAVVYQARALYNAIYTSTLVFSDNCEIPVTKSMLQNTNTKNEHSNADFDALVYPNPTTGTVYIAPVGIKCDNIQVNVTDLAGKVVYSSLLSIHEGICNFNLKIEPGIYFVKITDCSSDEKITKKLVIQ